MVNKQTGGPAFPYSRLGSDNDGMTLRDYFAAKALETMNWTVRPYDTRKQVAEDCYAMADAMLKAREA